MRVLAFVALISMAALCRPQSEPVGGYWDARRASKDLQTFAAEPHPMGSPRNGFLAAYIDEEMKAIGLSAQRLPFSVEVPDPELFGREASMMQRTTLPLALENVTVRLKSRQAKSCVFLLGSHYDSKRLDGVVSLGANDSGSSSAALMELMRGLKEADHPFRCHVQAIWFDGEEAYLPNWSDGETRHPAKQVDNTYGSRDFVDKLKACSGGYCLPEEWGGERVGGLILLDMIGSNDLRLSPEANSTPELMTLARALDREMFAGSLYGDSSTKHIEDDHIPFLKKGIPAVDLIGFETLDHWHQPTDTIEKVSVKSMEKAANLAEAMLKKILIEE